MTLKVLLLAAVSLSAYDKLQEDRWKAAELRPERASELRGIANRIIAARARYEAVAKDTGVPWQVTAALHNMECSGSFNKHLHEGSPLSGRTRWVPKGRPPTGKPPFKWEVSAADALFYDKMASKDWSRLGPSLSAIELYNGPGFMKYHKDVATPYLWGGMRGAYGVGKPGKYISDGKWSSTAITAQIGVAAIWKELEKRGAVVIPSPR